MSTMTINDLHRILVACAGEAEGVVFDNSAQDTDFADLGYDSLALMEAATRIEQEFGVKVPDERIPDLRTPRDLLELVNGAVVEAA